MPRTRQDRRHRYTPGSPFSYPFRDDAPNAQHALLAPPSVLLERCPRELYHGVSPAHRHRWQRRRGRRGRRRTSARTAAPNTPGCMSQRREMNHLLLPQSVRVSAVGFPARRRCRRCPARVRRPRVARRIRSRRNHPPRMPVPVALGVILS